MDLIPSDLTKALELRRNGHWVTRFGSLSWSVDARLIAAKIREIDPVMHHWQSVPSDSIHEVVSKQLVEDLEVKTRELIRLDRSRLGTRLT